MSANDATTGWVCVDCLVLLANGETPPEMSERETEEWLKSVTDTHMTLGMMSEEHICDYETDWHAGRCDCEHLSFSWSSCDSCGSRLGGERHAVTFWNDVR